MSELKKHTLKVRVTELENRLNNLQILVANIAANQEEIVKAITTNDVAKIDSKEMPNQLRIDDEADRICDDEDCEEKVCLVDKCKK